MKIVKLKGGLGNQMFQYAFAKNIEMLTGEEVKLDISAYKIRKNDSIRKPRIFEFKISENIANKSQIKQICKINHNYDLLSPQYKLSVQLENLINPDYFFRHDCNYIPIEQICKYKYFDGYWQAWRYIDAIKDKLQEELIPQKKLSLKSNYMIETLKDQNSVFVGIRKGDYSSSWVTKRKYGEFSIKYYLEAMKYISNSIINPVFYIFSNDIEWVKNNMVFDKFNVCYRDTKDQISDFEEMILMASCRHAIIANSTFHWWGAWLNDYPGKIVIAPNKWFTNGWKDEIIPPRWVKMKRQ